MGLVDNVHSWAASVAAGGRGLAARNPRADRPAEPLVLYEYEACPYCRKVREAMSEVDLDYKSVPCSKGSRHRAELVAAGGKQQVPYLVDPNNGTAMYESDEIVAYLRKEYGGGAAPAWQALLGPANTARAMLASVVRRRGSRSLVGPPGRSEADLELLELWNFEASPYCRKVREVLCELDLPYLVHNVAKGSPRRPRLVALGGKMQVPYLVDPNAGVAMYESDAIVSHLRANYARPRTHGTA